MGRLIKIALIRVLRAGCAFIVGLIIGLTLLMLIMG